MKADSQKYTETTIKVTNSTFKEKKTFLNEHFYF